MPTNHSSETKIPRPPNAFMCFRSARASEHAAGVRQNELSKRVGAEWRALDPATRAHFVRVAAEKKEEHGVLYPGYKYQPQRRGAAVGPGTRAGASMARTPSASTRRAAYLAPPPEPHFASLPLSTASYSPFASSAPDPAPTPPPAPAPATWYVPVPAATFAALVNAPSPPARTVLPAALHTPHLLAYASLRELADAVALPLAASSPPAPASAHHGAVLFVPVPVKAFRQGARARGAALEAFPSMRALEAVAVLEGAPEAFLDPMFGVAEAVAGLDVGDAGGSERGLRYPEGSVPFLDEETRWLAVYPGMGGGAC